MAATNENPFCAGASFPAPADLAPPDQASPVTIGEAADLSTDHGGHKPRQAAFELKFLIDDALAIEIMEWARRHLGPDSHCDPELGDGYRVNSLYLDTPQYDLFHRTPDFCQRKFRLRRYGREPVIYCEQKKKRKGLVRKKRVCISDSEIAARLHGPADVNWEGHWFQRRVAEQALRPVCQIVYERFARVTTKDDGPVRLTIDHRVEAAAVDTWAVPQGRIDGIPLLDGTRILELKFRGAMPVLFRDLIDRRQLHLTSFSKYRTSVEECVSLDAIAGEDLQGANDG